MNSDFFADKCFLVWDHHGLFLSTALRLAESGAKVWYHTPQGRRDLLEEEVIGDGLQQRGVFWTDEPWLHKNEVDTFVFPDVRHCGEQIELESQGIAVWGAKKAMYLELNREKFLNVLKDLKLDVPDYEVVVGVENLAVYLKDKKDIFIKTSKWRGTWETTRWRSQQEDGHKIDCWRVKYGPLGPSIRFICMPKIETKLEIGADTHNIDGQWPTLMLHGIEDKDEAYFGAVTAREEMPSELMDIMEAFSPILEERRYRCQWSMEVRVRPPHNFFTDATTRGGLPSTASLLRAKNVPEIIYHGARGEMVNPNYGFRFCAECMVKISGGCGEWATVLLDPEVRKELMLSQFCEVNGQAWFPPDDKPTDEIGWLRAVGDTPTEVAHKMNKLADALPDGADASVEALADVFREIEAEHDTGISFTDEPIPDPEVVLEES